MGFRNLDIYTEILYQNFLNHFAILFCFMLHILFIFSDHITSGTAIKMPVEELIELFHSKGIVVIVDGAHAPGQIPLNIQTLAPDFYICE